MNHLLQTNKIFRFGLLISLLPFLLISIYNFPAGFDDFNNAILVQKKGELGALKFFYQEWTGRYTLTILLAFLNPIKYGYWFSGIKITPVITLFLFLLSCAYLIKGFYNSGLNRKDCFFGSLAFLVLYLFAVPTTADIFYWFSGACTYAIGLIFFMLSVGGIIRFASATIKSTEVGSLAISIISLIGAIGANESILMGLLFLSFIAFLYAFFLKSSSKYIFLFLFFIALAFSLISILAPGNSVRSDGMHSGESVYVFSKIFKAALHSLYFTSVNAVSWINNFVLILFTFLFIPPALTLIKKKAWLRSLTSIHPFIGIGLSLIFLSVQAFPSYLGMSDVDPRVWSSIYFFFLISWFFIIALCLNYWEEHISNMEFKYNKVCKIFCVFLLLFSGMGNVNQAWFDLFVRAPKYSASLQNRYDLILKSKNQDLIVPPIFERTYLYPKTIYSSDISTNVSSYTNTSLSEYFGLKSIRIKNDPVR